MGLITKMVTKSAIKLAGKTAVTKTVNHMENKHSVTKIQKKGTMKNNLLIEKKSFIGRKKFLVSSKDEKVKYSIQSEDKNMIRLLNLSDKEIGKVIIKKQSDNILEFNLYLDDKSLGYIQYVNSLKTKFNIPFNAL